MLWFLGNLFLSSGFHNYILGHYELPTSSEEITGLETISYSAPGLVWVANSLVEVLERGSLIIGSITFSSALVSYLLYKAIEESLTD
jgi:hypothetical protein